MRMPCPALPVAVSGVAEELARPLMLVVAPGPLARGGSEDKGAGGRLSAFGPDGIEG